jgi:hypothetical protein
MSGDRGMRGVFPAIGAKVADRGDQHRQFSHYPPYPIPPHGRIAVALPVGLHRRMFLDVIKRQIVIGVIVAIIATAVTTESTVM